MLCLFLEVSDGGRIEIANFRARHLTAPTDVKIAIDGWACRSDV